jgi:hypothetical protein
LVRRTGGETTKAEDKGISKRSWELTNQSEGKLTILAISKNDQEIQNIRKDGDKCDSTNTEDNQVGTLKEEYQSGNQLNSLQVR